MGVQLGQILDKKYKKNKNPTATSEELPSAHTTALRGKQNT